MNLTTLDINELENLNGGSDFGELCHDVGYQVGRAAKGIYKMAKNGDFLRVKY